MSPKEKVAPAWRRQSAGTYRSADDRFTVRSEGSGRWFLQDEEERDELGLARMTGPFATLDAAKEEATRHRERKPEKSPLAARISPREKGKPRARARRREVSTARGAARASETWLDRLEKTDAAAARRARSLVRAVEEIGVGGAEDLVRRDLEGDRPLVAEAVLSVALRRAIAKVNDPARLLEVVLGVLSMREGLEGDERLPGWRLVEKDSKGERRIRVTPSDVLGEGTAGRPPRPR